MDKIWRITDDNFVTVVSKSDKTIINYIKNTIWKKRVFTIFGVAVVEW